MKCAEMHKDAQEGAQCHFTFVLSAEIPYRALCEGFFVKSGPKKVPFLPKMYQKKLLAGGQLSAKEGSKILDVLFIIFSDIISKILSF